MDVECGTWRSAYATCRLEILDSLGIIVEPPTGTFSRNHSAQRFVLVEYFAGRRGFRCGCVCWSVSERSMHPVSSGTLDIGTGSGPPSAVRVGRIACTVLPLSFSLAIRLCSNQVSACPRYTLGALGNQLIFDTVKAKPFLWRVKPVIAKPDSSRAFAVRV